MLFGWGLAIALIFTLVYAFGLDYIFAMLTDDISVITYATEFHWWCVAIPCASVAAFVWDGIYIGLTATRGMLIAIAVASASYFTVFFLLPEALGNHRLWCAFIAYLAMRGISQTILYRKNVVSLRS